MEANWQVILTIVGGLLSIVGVFLAKVLTQIFAFLLDFAKNAKGNGNGGMHAVTHLMLEKMEARDNVIIEGQKLTNGSLNKLTSNQEKRIEVLDKVEMALNRLADSHLCPFGNEETRAIRLAMLKAEMEKKPQSHEL